MVLTWLVGWGVALATEPVDVVRSLGRGASVNWSDARLEGRSERAAPVPGTSRSAREQAAIAAAQARLEAWIGTVAVLPGVKAASLEGFDVRRAVEGWTALETRYHQGGEVEVVGGVDLRAALAPWSVSRSVQPEVKPPQGPSGVVIDARGLEVEPSFAPRVVAPDGAVLYEGVLWRAAAFEVAPCAWVTSLAAPAAAVAGPTPVLLLASEVQDGAIVLQPDDAAVYRDQVVGTAAHGSGAIVIVVDR